MGRLLTRGVAAIAAVLSLAAPADAAPGDLDPSFGKNGVVELSGKVYPEAFPLPDGGVLVRTTDIESVQSSSNALIKLDASGNLVSEFGDGGTLAFSPGIGISVAVAPDGRIVVATRSSGQVSVTRLLPDGTEDPSFGEGGDSLPFGSDAAFVSRIFVGADGAITLAGSRGGDLVVARLRADGSLDTGFGGGGVSDALDGTSIEDAEPSGNGSLYVALGSRSPVNTTDTEVIRLTASGDIDPSWADGGLALPSLALTDMAPANGKLVILSYTQTPPYMCLHGCANNPVLMELGPDGEPDEAFTAAAADLPSIGPESNREFNPYGVFFDHSSRLVVTGSMVFESYGEASFYDAAIARLLPSGEPDEEFGRAGLATLPNETVHAGAMLSAFVDTRGRIVSSGAQRTIGSRGSVIRLRTTGKRHDADADGVLDRRDACPRVPGKRADGCRLYRSSLTIRYGPFGFSGKLSARPRCIYPEARQGKPRGSLIRVLEVGPGPDEMVAQGRAEKDGSWLAQRRVDRGAYYAAFAQRQDADIAVCAAAKSNRIQVPQASSAPRVRPAIP